MDSLSNRCIVSSSELTQGPLSCSHRNRESNDTSTDIKDSKFVDYLYIEWPVAKQQYASRADVMDLPSQDYHTPITNPYNSQALTENVG